MEGLYEYYKARIRVSDKASKQIWHPHTRQLWDQIIVDLKEHGIEFVTDCIKTGMYEYRYNNITEKDIMNYYRLLETYYKEDKE